MMYAPHALAPEPPCVEDAGMNIVSREFPELSRKQHEAIAEWRVRFRSFRSGSIDLARETARTAAGRLILNRALDAYVGDFEEAQYLDDEEVGFFARQFANCWPESESAPAVQSGRGDIAREVSAMIRRAFDNRSGTRGKSGPISRAG